MTEKSILVKSEGITLSLLVWQFLKRQPEGYLEKVLNHNVGLADLGPVLPIGTVVIFPLDEITSSAPERALVRLWD